MSYNYCKLIDSGSNTTALMYSPYAVDQASWQSRADDAEAAWGDFINSEGHWWDTRTPSMEDAWRAGTAAFVALIMQGKIVRMVPPKARVCKAYWT